MAAYEEGDDEGVFAVPAVSGGSGMGAKKASGMGLRVDAGDKHLKEAEEADVRGADVKVVFELPGGKTETASFPLGQDVGFLKAHVARATDIPITAMIFRLASTGEVLIDPLSLRDYEAIRTAAGSITITVSTA